MLDERLQARLRREMAQIEELLGRYERLIADAQKSAPNIVEVAALASVLHSFYTGVESIFTCIVRRVDNTSPSGGQWHRELLAQAAAPTERRPSVISSETRERLEA